MSTAGLKIIFAGAGEFGLPTLRALCESGHELVQVVSQPDRPSGRGRKLTPTAIAQFGSERSLPLLRTANINSETLPAADVMVVIAFGQKVAPHAVDHPRLGSINLHASLLPKYRGAAPINWAIINGETETGNSVIRLAQKMDAGAILGQSRFTIGETETAGELHDRLAADGPSVVLSTIQALASGAAQERVQDESLATLAPKMSRESAKLDWSQSATALANRIRGMNPWPGCHVRLVSQDGSELSRMTLVRARGLTGEGAGAGRIDSAGLVDGRLEIIEVQPEGKRAMSLADYRRGHPWPEGARLESIA